MVVETLLLLGDVSMESENFEQASQDYAEALEVKKKYLWTWWSRASWSSTTKLALAYARYNKETANALENLEAVKQVLTKHQERLTQDLEHTERLQRKRK